MAETYSFDLLVDNKLYRFNASVLQRSEQLVRFLLTINGHELLLQKRVLLKHNPWGIQSSSFEFKREDSAYTLLRIFKILDTFLGHVKKDFDPQKREK